MALLMFLVGWLVAPADAARPSLDPEVKLHGGYSMVKGPRGSGFTLGFDSRMTRSIYVDLGGFFSPAPLTEEYAMAEDLEPISYFRLRHGIYVLPGFRVPHKQPKAFSWDVILRAGPAVAWSADLTPNFTPNHERLLEVDSAFVGGADFQVKRESWGVRLSARGLLLAPFYEDNFTEVLFWGTQFGLEALYQF